MDETWSDPDVTSQDVRGFMRALSLEDKPRAPLIAVASADDGVSRLVVASRALFGLFGVTDAPALSNRLLNGTDPGSKRLAVLCRTLPLEGAPRLERLRFFLGPGSEIITFLCRRMAVRGRPVFIAAALGVRPGLIAAAVAALPPAEPEVVAEPGSVSRPLDLAMTDLAARAPAAPDPAGDQASPEPDIAQASDPVAAVPVSVPVAAVKDAAALQADLRHRWPKTRTLRFLWHTDADAVCTLITPPLADVVGPGTADLVGRNLLDLASRLDATGRLAACLAARETWSGLDLQWPLADAAATVAVTAGAIPAFDADKAFDGFRGFGVIHLDRLTAATPAPLPPAASERAQPLLEAVNVVPFPARTLSTDDQVAFRAIGEVLREQTPKDEPGDEPAKPKTPSSLGPEIEPAALLSKPSNLPSREPAVAHVETPVADPAAVAGGPEPGDALAPSDAPEPSDRSDGRHPRHHESAAMDGPIETVSAPEGAARGPRAEAVSAADDASLMPQSHETARQRDIGRNGLAILDKLALGLLVSRNNVPIFANRHVLDMLGFPDEDALHDAGGMTHLFGGLPGNVTGSEAVGVRKRDGSILHANARMQAIEWDDLPATLLTLKPGPDPSRLERDGDAKRQSEDARRQQDAELRELRAILETATDGVAVLDASCNVLSLNRSGEALFGRDRGDVVGKPFLALFAPHNQSLAADYFEGLKSNATKSLLNDGREFLIKTHQGGTIPVFMTLGKLGPSSDVPMGAPEEARFCALFRDLTHFKKAEQELDHARQEAERASALKSDFLAKVSHEIRTPLNAIIGFAEVIMDERFGPVGNARYKDYLKDIHQSGTHVMSLVNDLLDLSKIEAGKMELNAVAIDANKIINECVGLMQPQASQERVIMRLSLAATLPRIKADERSLRQIVLNLLSNAVKFNEPGGQVIIATAHTEMGQVVIRIRDTGPGMSDKDIETALEPFRQLSTSRPMTTGTGLGLPLTKALVEANQASFTIRSKVDQGTLVEVAFPPAQVLAD